MTATVFFDSANEVALLSNTFLDLNQQPADPTTVTCVITEPANVSVTHSYNLAPPADIVRVSAGKYTLSIPCSPSVTDVDGLWEGLWVGTGAVSDVQPSTWRVLPANTGQLFYCGIEELKSRLDITDSTDDYELQLAIQSVSSWINEWCVVPETPILTADLRWVPAGDLVLGQELIGVDEEPVTTGRLGPAGWLMTSNRNRFYRRSEVRAIPLRMAECVRLILEDGREVTCATDHGWLTRRFLSSQERQHYGLPPDSRNGGYAWRAASEIKPGDEIASPLRVWPEETGFEAGWVSGLYDGEGWLTGQAAAHTSRMGVAQNPGFVLDKAVSYLDRTGIPYSLRKQRGGYAREDSRCVRIEVGARWAAMELMGRLRPIRLLPRAAEIWEDGRVIRSGKNGVRVVAAESAGTREVVSLGTSTGTYLANGLISHNCGCHFNRITETRTFRPYNIWELTISPLVSVSALNVDVDGDGVFEQPWTQGTDYQLKLQETRYNINELGVQRPYTKVQTVQSGKWFPFVYPYSHFDRVQIIGTWGWPSVPPPVTQAALILSSDVFKFKDAPFGVAGISDFGVTKIQTNPWLVEMLRPYIVMQRKVGV